MQEVCNPMNTIPLYPEFQDSALCILPAHG